MKAALQYIITAASPGGTPKRLKEWAGIILGVQALVLLGPYAALGEPLQTAVLCLLLLFIGISVSVWRNPAPQRRLFQITHFLGIGLQVFGAFYTDADLIGILYLMVWSLMGYLSEQRGYTPFIDGLLGLFIVFISLAINIYIADDFLLTGKTGIGVGVSGFFFSSINVYLIYIDYRSDHLKAIDEEKQYLRIRRINREISSILQQKAPLEELLWDITQSCIPLFELEDFVIYLYQENGNRLVQVAAYGDKNNNNSIINPIELTPGKGIVGKVFLEGKTRRVVDTTMEPDYMLDDRLRFSELAVPIYSEGKVVGVLDSEHSLHDYYKDEHVQAFEIIAAFCGIKISEMRSRERMREIESVKKLAEQLQELDTLKNKFITNISHDFKTPLSLIKGPARKLAQVDDEAIAKQGKYIARNAEHLQQMLEQLLQLQRLDHGLKHLYPENFFLKDLIEPIKERNELPARNKNITMGCDYSGDAQLYTDRFKLEQCIQNLVQNALRYTPDGGRVFVSIKPEGENLIIQVEDNGLGIPKELQEKVFMRFYKLDENNHEGTGIGLSLVKEYAEMLQGSVRLESEEGQGCKFTIMLPIRMRIEEEELSMPELLREEEETGQPIVLVIEDHQELNEFIADTLRQQYQVIQAFDGNTAWELIRQRLPDLIVSDLMLPGMNGEEVLKHMKADSSTAHIPVVVLSAKDKVSDKVELYQLGVENYLPKPFDEEELIAVVENCFSRRKELSAVFMRRLGGSSAEPTKMDQQEEELDQKEDALLQEAIDIVLEHLDDHRLNGHFLSEKLGMGRNRLQREIKSVSGLSPAEFIRSVRLSEAKKLLEKGRLTVSEVAYAVGFNNLSYFTRAFKTQFDMLPSELNQEAVRL